MHCARDHLELRLMRVGACSLSASRSAVTVQAAAAAPLTYMAARGRALSRQSRSADMQVRSLPRLVLNALRPFVPGSALKATSVAEIGCALAAMAGQLAPSTSTSLRPSSCWWAAVQQTCRWNPGMERRGRPRSGERLQGRQRRYERWCLTAPVRREIARRLDPHWRACLLLSRRCRTSC